ncbi:MAG: type II toxin-antitoxin system prevent-host-death family antitoxin [Thermodesulfobacteriota bacterium]|jgi:prevent-host-death family protein
MEINSKEARSKLSSLLDRVEKGDEIVILRRGEKVARLIPSLTEGRKLPSLKKFRSSIRIKGESLRAMVLRQRAEERY